MTTYVSDAPSAVVALYGRDSRIVVFVIWLLVAEFSTSTAWGYLTVRGLELDGVCGEISPPPNFAYITYVELPFSSHGRI